MIDPTRSETRLATAGMPAAVAAPPMSARLRHAWHTVATTARTLWAAAIRRYRLHRAVAELEALDDRTLRDMGVQRDNIKSLVHTKLRHPTG